MGKPMRKLTLRESQAPYNVALDDTLLTDEVVILEKDGRPVAALVPIGEYTAFQAWREEERRRQARQEEEAAIEREHAAFNQMLPELLNQYPGRVVAIYNGQVVGVGDDEAAVWEEARRRFKGVPIYVQVVEYPPRVYKMPHRKVTR
jgi:antitoxin (DNA-binding transcriptional repressor) of toxin-antitoxin stability system